MSLEKHWPVAAAAAFTLPAVVLLGQQFVPGLNPVLHAPVTHVVVVTGIASVAAVVALVAAVPAVRRRRGEPLLLALGALWLAVLFIGHGLTTPGVLDRPVNAWVGRLPVLALAAFALCQLLGVLHWARPLRTAAAARPLLVLAGGLAGAVLLVGHVLGSTGGVVPAWNKPAPVVVAATTAPAPAPAAETYGYGDAPDTYEIPAASAPAAEPADAGGHSHPPSRPAPDRWPRPLSVATALALALAGVVHLRRWRVVRDGVQLALALACGTAAEASVAMLLSEVWAATWWDYHALLMVGFGSTVAAVWLASRRGVDLPDVLDGRWLRDPSALLAHGSPEVLHALVAAVEAKHVATRGHSARVSALAVQLGERLGMSPEQLRTTAQGALLHDIGKIGVPDEILTKPGPLTAEERARVEEHPVIGWEIVRQAPSLDSALDAVRYHHERLDGTGYPDGLCGDEIPLLARIVAVADVYDALTSARDYRSAWSPGRALAHMVAARGTHFDGRCLDAFLELQREEGRVPDRQHGQPGQVREALSACHAEAPALVPEPRRALVPAQLGAGPQTSRPSL